MPPCSLSLWLPSSSSPPYWTVSWGVLQRSLWSNLVFLGDGLLVSFAVGLLRSLRDRAEDRLAGAVESLDALRGRTRTIRLIFDNMFPHVALLDLDGKIVEISRTLISKEGQRIEDLLERSFVDRKRWTYDPAVHSQLLSVLDRARKGETVRYDTRVWTAEGLLPIDLQVSPVRDGSGRVEALLLSSVEIADREEALRRLKESEERFRTLFDSADDGILIVGEKGEIEDPNPTLCLWLGYSREEMVGRKLSEFVARLAEDGSLENKG